MNTQKKKGRAESLKRPTLTAKRDRAFVGAPTFVAATKTSATAEGGTKKSRFYKLLAKEFRRSGFKYRQLAREGNAAIYEQTRIGCPEPSVAYEVIRIRCRDGFLIGGRFVEPAEVYPASELWGRDGFTFTDRTKAWVNFFEMSLEKPERTGKEVN